MLIITIDKNKRLVYGQSHISSDLLWMIGRHFIIIIIIIIAFTSCKKKSRKWKKREKRKD